MRDLIFLIFAMILLASPGSADSLRSKRAPFLSKAVGECTAQCKDQCRRSETQCKQNCPKSGSERRSCLISCCTDANTCWIFCGCGDSGVRCF